MLKKSLMNDRMNEGILTSGLQWCCRGEGGGSVSTDISQLHEGRYASVSLTPASPLLSTVPGEDSIEVLCVETKEMTFECISANSVGWAGATIVIQWRKWGLGKMNNLPTWFGQAKPQSARSATLVCKKGVGCSRLLCPGR